VVWNPDLFHRLVTFDGIALGDYVSTRILKGKRNVKNTCGINFIRISPLSLQVFDLIDAVALREDYIETGLCHDDLVWWNVGV
jgi:hypothetical protein